MKLKPFAVIVAVLLVFVSCQQPTNESQQAPEPAQVRFQNYMTGTYKNINYGVRMGQAIHDGAITSPGVTSYYSTPEGAYSVQFKSSDGAWMTVSGGSLLVQSGKHYTMAISGDAQYATLQFQIILDY